MSLFAYQAKDIEGKTQRGMVEAVTRELAVEILTDRNLTPISVDEERRNYLSFLSAPLSRIKTKDIVIMSRQLAVLTSATVPIVQALRILEKQTANAKLKVVISEVADEVDGGAKLSAALGKYPEVFSEFYINMVNSGENSGKIDEVLNYLADEEEKSYDLVSKIRGAMIYPCFILFGLLVVGAIMMIFVVPKLTGILIETGAELPFSTKILVSVSSIMATYWWLLLILLVGGIIALRFYVKSPSGKHMWHMLQLRLPVIGSIYKHIYLVRFARSMHTLVVGGVPLTRSLAIVSGVVGSEVYKELVEQTIREVEDGNSIGNVFSQSPYVPSMVSQMLIVGEKTGRLEEIFKRLADFYAREVEALVVNLVTLLEPAIMMIMGVAVAFMVSAVLLPLYNLSGAA